MDNHDKSVHLFLTTVSVDCKINTLFVLQPIYRFMKSEFRYIYLENEIELTMTGALIILHLLRGRCGQF